MNPWLIVFSGDEGASVDFTQYVHTLWDKPADTPTAKVAFMLELTRHLIKDSVNFHWSVMPHEDEEKWWKVLDNIVTARDILNEMTEQEQGELFQ
jgi:hypothetical protein